MTHSVQSENNTAEHIWNFLKLNNTALADPYSRELQKSSRQCLSLTIQWSQGLPSLTGIILQCGCKKGNTRHKSFIFERSLLYGYEFYATSHRVKFHRVTFIKCLVMVKNSLNRHK